MWRARRLNSCAQWALSYMGGGEMRNAECDGMAVSGRANAERNGGDSWSETSGEFRVGGGHHRQVWSAVGVDTVRTSCGLEVAGDVRALVKGKLGSDPLGCGAAEWAP